MISALAHHTCFHDYLEKLSSIAFGNFIQGYPLILKQLNPRVESYLFDRLLQIQPEGGHANQ